jgi:tetratricopeptide (TPR) repeat protein
MLESRETAARSLDAELERVRTLTALGHFEAAAASASKLGGQDPLQELISLTQSQRETPGPVQIAQHDAARIAALARAQAAAVLRVATALTKQSRSGEAAPLLDRAKTVASIEMQLGAADQGRADYAQALALASSPEWSIDIVSGRVAASAQAARALVAVGRSDDAFAILDDTLLKFRSNPLGVMDRETNLITVDELWSAQRQQDAAITVLLVTGIELAIEAGRQPLAVHYADEALQHTKHAPASDHVRVATAVAAFDAQVGNIARAMELLAEAEQKIAGDLESDRHPAWYLDVARAYSRIKQARRAQQIWLQVAAHSRFGDPANVIAACDIGLECLGREPNFDAIAQITDMVEDVDRMALLV